MYEGLMKQQIAEVAFKVPVDSLFDYIIPDNLKAQIKPGNRVYAPFGPRKMAGYCVQIKEKSRHASLKSIISIVDPQISLSEKLLKLGMWISDYYLEPPGMVLEAMMPAAVRKSAQEHKIRFARLIVTPEEALKASEKFLSRFPARAAILRELAAQRAEISVNELAASAGVSPGVVSTLAKKGLVAIVMRLAAAAAHDEIPSSKGEAPPLTSEQQSALAAARKARKSPAGALLLHGATASGKTEVYIQAIKETVADGREAIVLVPEISLTPQTISRFSSRFESIAILHSALTNAQRRQQWLRIARGEAQVIIGARSAIFAPTRNLGIIVIDEEHEPSFKQSSSPRYHARDVALQRGIIEDALVIFGSATPSLESVELAKTARIGLVRMRKRIDNLPMPHVEIIDMRSEKTYGGSTNLSTKLCNLMEQRLSRSEQIMLFLNRRGFSTFIVCRRCGMNMRCPQCAVSLRYHRGDNLLLCHYCGHAELSPSQCPDCGAPVLNFAGTGTEKLYDEVSRRFPKARLARMDSDTMKNRKDYVKTLSAFGEGNIDILLGTQMIAKGLDFPNLTLVGIIAADAGLITGDFRASERTFQLIEQVSGRTGRAKLGYVVLQTYAPETRCIQHAARHDYRGFIEEELPSRASLGYPPTGLLIRVLAAGGAKKSVETVINKIALKIRDALGENGKLLGPAPAPIERIQNQWRIHLLVKLAPGVPASHLRASLSTRKASGGVSITVDVNPYDML